MKNIIEKIVYCRTWDRTEKEALKVYDSCEAQDRFTSGEHFFAVLYANEFTNLPSHLLEFLPSGTIGVSFLDEWQGEYATYQYQHLKDHPKIDSDRLIMTNFVIRETDRDGTQTLGTACYPVMMEDGKMTIQDFVFCDETDYVKRESYNYYSKNRVDVESLYKDIPKFGEWEQLILDTELRFLDE